MPLTGETYCSKSKPQVFDSRGACGSRQLYLSRLLSWSSVMCQKQSEFDSF